LLTSAVVAALISGLVSVLVARSTAQATVKAAQVAARGERAKAGDEERHHCRAALRAAVEGWHTAALRDADWRARQEGAGRARAALIEVSAILGQPVRTTEFDQLVELLAADSEEDIETARVLWPLVQQTIVTTLPRLDLADLASERPPA